MLFPPAALDEIVVGAEIIRQLAAIEFHDAVCHGLDELVVVGCKEDVSLEVRETVVDGGDRLQVHVVRGLVQH